MTPEQGNWTEAETALLVKLRRNDVSYKYCAAQIEGRSAGACTAKWRWMVANGLSTPAPHQPKPVKAPKRAKTEVGFDGLVIRKRVIIVTDRSIPGHAGPRVPVSVSAGCQWASA